MRVGEYESRQMESLTEERRLQLRRRGKIMMTIGIVLFGLPFVAIPLAMVVGMMGGFGVGIGAFAFVPIAFLGAFPGIILIAIGGYYLRFGYMRKVADITSVETAGAVEHTSAAMARGFRQANFGSGRDVIKVKCRSCGFLESEDARFCSQCAKPV